jgi:hypothetical protein
MIIYDIIIIIIVILFTVYSINITTAKAERSLNVSQSISPNNVVVGQNATLSITISNQANNTTTINSVYSKSALFNLTVLDKPVNLITNRIFYISKETRVPQDISAGQYSIDTIVNSSKGDYIASTSLRVDRLESIPFSGNVPLSVLTLVYLGVITYTVASYRTTGKFERSYLELGLAGIGLGFLNWFIARLLYLVSPNIESINKEPLGLVFLFIIAIVLGLLIAQAIKAIMWFSNRSKRIKEFIERQRKGYYEPHSLVLPEYFRSVLEYIKENLGSSYSIALRVHLKTPYKTPYNESKRVIEGILSQYEKKQPYDIVIVSKQIVECDDLKDIVSAFKNHPDRPLEKILHKDKSYRKKVIQYLERERERERDERRSPEQITQIVTSDESPEQITQVIIDKLEKTGNNDEFIDILEKIDFSRCVIPIVDQLLKERKKQEIEYKDATGFIAGDNILGVEIIKYETFSAISFKDNNIVPKSYYRDELHAEKSTNIPWRKL